jgi:hypothetical protein
VEKPDTDLLTVTELKRFIKEILNKSYHNKNLDKIIQDIFKKDNCAFTWLYKNNRLNQVVIWIIEEAKVTNKPKLPINKNKFMDKARSPSGVRKPSASPGKFPMPSGI